MTDIVTEHLIVGAGITGLAFANFLDTSDFLIVEKDDSIGGWCKTIEKDGFVWDYSGHFFHFKHPEIEAYLRERMPGEPILTVEKRSHIYLRGHRVDFPFQKNIHQLPRELFIDCLYDLFFRDELPEATSDSFRGMLMEKFGASISELFLIPYNEKLYACDLETLDRHAMGRFFPHADLRSILRNMKHPDNATYNASFTYPLGGAIKYVEALARDIPAEKILLSEGIVALDLARKVATLSSGRTVGYQHLISSAPFNQLLTLSRLPHDSSTFSANQVLVFNLGFDRKGPRDVHWIYYPDRDVSFYRVGFYDNIMGSDRMSLYVEIGQEAGTTNHDLPAIKARVLEDLRDVGVLTDQQLVASHSVVLNPAYVHITEASRKAFADLDQTLQCAGVHSVGRYGGWTYCSIEDNIVEARELAGRFNLLTSSFP